MKSRTISKSNYTSDKKHTKIKDKEYKNQIKNTKIKNNIKGSSHPKDKERENQEHKDKENKDQEQYQKVITSQS